MIRPPPKSPFFPSPTLFRSLSLCDTSSRIPAEAKPQWDDRIRTAEAKGMEPLVEPTLARWFTAPFREKKKDVVRSEEHTSELQSQSNLVCRLLLEKKKNE